MSSDAVGPVDVVAGVALPVASAVNFVAFPFAAQMLPAASAAAPRVETPSVVAAPVPEPSCESVGLKASH